MWSLGVFHQFAGFRKVFGGDLYREARLTSGLEELAFSILNFCFYFLCVSVLSVLLFVQMITKIAELSSSVFFLSPLLFFSRLVHQIDFTALTWHCTAIINLSHFYSFFHSPRLCSWDLCINTRYCIFLELFLDLSLEETALLEILLLW